MNRQQAKQDILPRHSCGIEKKTFTNFKFNNKKSFFISCRMLMLKFAPEKKSESSVYEKVSTARSIETFTVAYTHCDAMTSLQQYKNGTLNRICVKVAGA